LTVRLTIADLLTAPAIDLEPEQGREFRRLMECAATLLGARATPEAVCYEFRMEEHRTDQLFAIAFTAGTKSELRHVIVAACHADELGRLLEAAVNLLAEAAAPDRCTPLYSPPA
jgi:hypothetical protein